MVWQSYGSERSKRSLMNSRLKTEKLQERFWFIWLARHGLRNMTCGVRSGRRSRNDISELWTKTRSEHFEWGVARWATRFNSGTKASFSDATLPGVEFFARWHSRSSHRLLY